MMTRDEMHTALAQATPERTIRVQTLVTEIHRDMFERHMDRTALRAHADELMIMLREDGWSQDAVRCAVLNEDLLGLEVADYRAAGRIAHTAYDGAFIMFDPAAVGRTYRA